MDIYEKLGTIQTKLKAPKNQFNKFGNYYYRNAEDIQEAVKPLLAETKTVLTISDDIVMVGDRFYIRATAQISDIEGKATIQSTAYAREPMERKGMDDAQVTGATSSYARKYALCGLFLLDDTKDADSMDNSKEQPQKAQTKATQQRTASKSQTKQTTQQSVSYGSKKPETEQNKRPIERFATNDQLETIRKELIRTGVSEEAIMDRYHVSGLGGLTERDAADAIKGLAKSKSVGFDSPTEDEGLPWA